MARKIFFAAFVIDEESYTPEPGPVDRHFVAADLVQSSFGEQPGVSNVIVWDSLDDLIAEHRQQGPITIGYLTDGATGERTTYAHPQDKCPSNHRNRGDDICADCGAHLNAPPATTRAGAMPALQKPSFRDQLSPAMQNTLVFEYYEVRPCIEHDCKIASYRDEDDYASDLAAAQSSGREFRTFWSLYGLDAGIHTAIGDFVSKSAAHEVMNAILAIPAAVRNAIDTNNPIWLEDIYDIEEHVRDAVTWLDDMINQSSNAVRI